MNPIDTSSFSLQNGLIDELQRRANGARSTQQAQDGLPPEQHREVKKAAEGFESMFVHMMLKEMRKNIQQSDESKGQTFGADTLGGYADLQLADSLSQNNALGIAGMVYKELSGGFDMPNSVRTESLQTQTTSTPHSIQDMISTLRSTAQSAATESTGFGSFFDTVKERLRPFESSIQSAAKQFGLDTSLIKGVIAAESAGRSHAESAAGAKGLMQLMDATATDMGVIDSFDAEENIQGGSRYLSSMLSQFDGDVDLALAAYNAGPGNVNKYGGIPPFEETKNYISSVKRYSNVFDILEKNSLM